MFERRLLIVTGKGGTGRSAIAAALAIRAARDGHRVLALAMTDALGLAIHLSLSRLDYEPAPAQHGVWALAMDRTAALDEYMHLQLHLPRAAPLRPVARAFSVLAETVPGIRDAVTIGKISWETWSDEWDLVIADGPPLGQIESYLQAPATIASLVPSGRVQEQAAAMEELLADADDAGLIVATLAEELPALETVDKLAALESAGLCPVAEVIVNRVLPVLDTEPLDVPGPEHDAAMLHQELYAEQQEWLEILPGTLRLPYLFGMLTPGEVAARIADELP